ARLGCCHVLTCIAVERMLKFKDLDAQFFFKLADELLCFVCAVIVADPCMVAADNEMCAAVILTDNGMKNRFFWPCITHCCWIDREACSICRIVMLQNDLVTFHPHCR